MSKKPQAKKEQKLNENQFKKVVRAMARKAIKEHVAKKAAAKKKLSESKKRAAGKQKISAKQLREMVRDSILECLEEELDQRSATASKKPAKK